MGLAGQLIWALPMQSGARKGSGRRTAGTSFAVALSARPILGIGRIWADGREIRDAEGRFETKTVMRVHRGDAEQATDPLIAAAEDDGLAPDYRGIAYVVFEDFALGAFGNRIPNLSFEVIADEDGAESWLAEMGAEAGFQVPEMQVEAGATGFAAVSSRLADDAQTVAQTIGASPCLADGAFGFGGGRLFSVPAGDLIFREEAASAEVAVSARPAGLSIGYFDPARDYQAGRQRASRGRSGTEIESGGALTATAELARKLAARLLREAEAGAEVLSFALPWRWMEICVGDMIALDRGAMWRIVKRDVQGLLLLFEAERVAGAGSTAVAADPGRSLPAPLVPPVPTILRAFETPVPLRVGDTRIWVAAAGGPGWRGAEIRVLFGGDEISLGAVGSSAPFGTLVEPLDVGPETIWDEHNSLLVQVMEDVPAFESRSAEAVLAGANLVLVGGELLQFQNAEFKGDGVVRLSRLLRGRFGTGYRMAVVEPGATVLQLRLEDLAHWQIPTDASGREIAFLASGSGDPPGGTELVHRVEGVGRAQMAPVHFGAQRTPDGAVRMNWVSRSAEAWDWSGEVASDTGFRWQFAGDDGELFTRMIGGSPLVFTLSDQVAWFGRALPSGECWLEAMGDGPMALRRSGSVRI
ncbi:phage tail protein [Sandaracinobacteroides hominis]|uniref:phage tail protein n=1 Tax=Sandaracinobacteroides hominis TaxID=2780086 RepID=UPI0018F46B5B|nr:phage tail protein [Sandaracinobacteroides hominis]